MDLKQVGYRAYAGLYRGQRIRIWGEHDDGGFGRIQRWWNYETCGYKGTGINELEAAKRHARSTVDRELDGRADYHFVWRDLFLGEAWNGQFSEEARKELFPEIGCTEAEAATAKKLLEEL